MASIITLRQEVLTGNKQLAASLTVKTWKYDAGMDKVVSYELLDGREGIIPINNIAGICQLKES
jgi:hypothetical protein